MSQIKNQNGVSDRAITLYNTTLPLFLAIEVLTLKLTNYNVDSELKKNRLLFQDTIYELIVS